MADLGKILIGFGIVVVILGGILWLAGHFTGKVPWLGRLPGDIYVERGSWRLYFPLGTSIVVSIVLSLVLWLFSRR
jgi:heme/copper-type cytochrome/quinol oxidase subunit 4